MYYCLNVFRINNKMWADRSLASKILNFSLQTFYLLVGEQLCAHHFHLDRDQSQRLECQTAPVSVFVLHTQQNQMLFCLLHINSALMRIHDLKWWSVVIWVLLWTSLEQRGPRFQDECQTIHLHSTRALKKQHVNKNTHTHKKIYGGPTKK